ncbi:Serine/threonine protein kinase [Batrachochytrium dendrobatidis]
MTLIDPLNPKAQLGSVIDEGRIKLMSILGEGSFAVVFLGKDLQTQTSYAVKCLYKTGLTDHQLSLQLREASQLQTLADHPNIVKLYKTIQTRDCLFLVLERCRTDLFDAIMRHDGFAEPTARRLFAQLADAVAMSHSKRIYHRDLKPENVLVTYPGDIYAEQDLIVKLTDFGLATTDAVSTEFGCGSVRYMAPECLAGDAEWRRNAPAHIIKSLAAPVAYSPPANDVWSLGIILINLLTGKNPWVEPSAKDKHYQAHILSPARLASASNTSTETTALSTTDYTRADWLQIRRQQQTNERPTRPDSFQLQFRFSDQLCVVLRRIFDLDPFRRPSVAELKALIDAVPNLMQPKDAKMTSKQSEPIPAILPPTPQTSFIQPQPQIYTKPQPNGHILNTISPAVPHPLSATNAAATTVQPGAAGTPQLIISPTPVPAAVSKPAVSRAIPTHASTLTVPVAQTQPKSAPSRPEFFPNSRFHYTGENTGNNNYQYNYNNQHRRYNAPSQHSATNGIFYSAASPVPIATPPSVTAAAAASAANAAENAKNRTHYPMHTHGRQHRHRPQSQQQLPPSSASRWWRRMPDQPARQSVISSNDGIDATMKPASIASDQMDSSTVASIITQPFSDMDMGNPSAILSHHQSMESIDSTANSSYCCSTDGGSAHVSDGTPCSTHQQQGTPVNTSELWLDESQDLVFDLEPSSYSNASPISNPSGVQTATSSAASSLSNHITLNTAAMPTTAFLSTQANSSPLLAGFGAFSPPSLALPSNASIDRLMESTGNMPQQGLVNTMPSATAPVLGSFARGISKKAARRRPGALITTSSGSSAGQGSTASSAHSGHLLSSASTIGAYSASSTISAGLSTVQPASRYPHHIYLSTIAPIAEKQQDEANCNNYSAEHLSTMMDCDDTAVTSDVDTNMLANHSSCNASTGYRSVEHSPTPPFSYSSQSNPNSPLFKNSDLMGSRNLMDTNSAPSTPGAASATASLIKIQNQSRSKRKRRVSPAEFQCFPVEHQLDNLSHSHENMSTSQNKQFLAQLQVRMPSTQPIQDIQQYTSAHPRCSTTTLPFLTPPSDFSSFLDLDRPKNDALSDEFTNNAIQSSAGLSGSNILQASATASLTKPDILHNAFYGLRSILYEMSDTDQSLPTLEQTLPGFDTPATSQT